MRKKITFTQNHIFENSKYKSTNSTWLNNFTGKKVGEKNQSNSITLTC